jgi:hypothetical protein
MKGRSKAVWCVGGQGVSGDAGVVGLRGKPLVMMLWTQCSTRERRSDRNCTSAKCHGRALGPMQVPATMAAVLSPSHRWTSAFRSK